MPDEGNDHLEQDTSEDSAQEKLVPVSESIRYRRRAQQAEGRIQELEQQLQTSKTALDARSEELAAAEALRDEAKLRLTLTENRMSAERLLADSGVVDVEAASLLLSKRVDLAEELEGESLMRAVEQLLIDKPYLRTPAGLPSKTASAKAATGSTANELAGAAQRAAVTGDRRDVAQYLRMRRQSALARNV